MISSTRQLLRTNVFFFVRAILSNQPSRTDPKYLNANRLSCFSFFAAFSGYVPRDKQKPKTTVLLHVVYIGTPNL